MSTGETVIVWRLSKPLEEETKKPKEWAELLCSRSNKGCGTVFWATKDSGRVVWDDDERCPTNEGWQTPCPTCKRPVGGHDTRFVLLAEPPKQLRTDAV